MAKIAYTGVFLDDTSKGLLRTWWTTSVGPLEEKELLMHHMTLQFKPSEDALKVAPLGLATNVRVVGYVNRDGVQAVAVEPADDGPLSDNAIPHITVALGEDRKAVESNHELAAGYEAVPYGPVLSGVVGAFSYKEGVLHTLE